MNRKQRGAASEGNETAGERGWFSRLRAQPGFRTAFVAFCLTVILGIGAPAAYAVWSSSVQGKLTVQTVKPPLPVVVAGSVSCGWEWTFVAISYELAGKLPSGSYVVASVKVSDKAEPKYYAVPNSGSFRLRDLPGLEGFINKNDGWGTRLSIAVTTAYLSQEVGRTPTEIPASSIVLPSSTAPATATAYYYASYFCNRL